MESLWCIKKNSIFEMMKDPGNYNTALIPCIGPECDEWDDGKCFNIHRAGK
jgi:hypothetical protein